MNIIKFKVKWKRFKIFIVGFLIFKCKRWIVIENILVIFYCRERDIYKRVYREY